MSASAILAQRVLFQSGTSKGAERKSRNTTNKQTRNPSCCYSAGTVGVTDCHSAGVVFRGRVLYAFDPVRNAILLLGGDKTGDKRWYKTHVPIADKLYTQHLTTLKN